MKVFVITFCYAKAGAFGLYEKAFFDEKECKDKLEELRMEDEVGIEYVMDNLEVEVSIQ